MSKTLDTLVEDIYDVFLSNKELSYADLQEFGEGVKSAVIRQVTEVREPSTRLRQSQIGKPNRKLWYDTRTDSKREELDGPTRIKFLFGDIMESLLILLIKNSGHQLTDEQKEVHVAGVAGHMDCKIDGKVVDIKTASPYGFKKFVDGTLSSNDSFGYIPQISSYARAEGNEDAAFLAFNKVTGQLALTPIHQMEMINAVDRVEELKQVVASDALPSRCYDDVAEGASGNRALAQDCHWCDHKVTCWSDANNGVGLRTFAYSNGPKHFTNVAKEPRVQEIV